MTSYYHLGKSGQGIHRTGTSAGAGNCLFTMSRAIAACFALLFVAFFAGCSKDDDSSSSLRVEGLTFTMNEVNGCSHSSGAQGTRFLFDTAYDNAEDLDIVRVLASFKGSNGDTTEEMINASSTIDTGSMITWGGCLRFFENEWFDVEARLEAADGTISNLSKVRLNKPEGAN